MLPLDVGEVAAFYYNEKHYGPHPQHQGGCGTHPHFRHCSVSPLDVVHPREYLFSAEDPQKSITTITLEIKIQQIAIPTK